MRLLIVVQARLGSTRLPGKVLLPLAGAPLLARQLERVRAAQMGGVPFDLAVATTWEKADEPVRALCRELSVPCVSGHPTDLLDRHRQAARERGADTVVKIPSDCPLIDPQVIDRVLGFYMANAGRYDYVSNLHPATYPDGNDVEVLPLTVLNTAWREAERPFEREHTTPFVWERPERFRLGNVPWESGRDLSLSHRFTIDYPEDYALIAAIYDALWAPDRPVFGLAEILDLLAARPDLQALNARYAGVNWYRHHLDELKTIHPAETRSPEAHR
ncbi:MAG TPA: glycosyltransferase family protein [Thermoanaerobaculia bacterium]|nr:glycosyltransferase family protein [Thermoanaerobaculia bacterium]